MTGAQIARELHGRRSGAGWIAQCPAHDDRSPSLSIRESDGSVLVHCHAGCAQEDVITALRDRGLWPERERSEWTPAERREWGRERRTFERDWQAARYWRRTAILLIEEALTHEKAKLFDATEDLADPSSIAGFTRMLERLKIATDSGVVAQYRDWRDLMPRIVRAMVQWGQSRELAEIRALATYLDRTAEATHG